MAQITGVEGSQVFDSRGNPTVHVEVTLAGGITGAASVPSGASTGSHEAYEMRDGDPKEFNGHGVQKAIANINREISKQIIGLECFEQRKLDDVMIELDGTPNKSRLGGNAILGVSLAVAVAAAHYKKLPLYRYLNSLVGFDVKPALPTPMFNIINGGAHAQNNLSFQEFMIIPDQLNHFTEKLEFGIKFFTELRQLLERMKLSTNTGDEGGYAPNLKDNEEAIELITKVGKVNIGLDVAGQGPTMPSYWEKLTHQFPIVYIEDPVEEDNWGAWKEISMGLQNKVTLCGDDLFVTNPERFQAGIEQKVGNALIIKPNQIGTLTETLKVIKMAHEAHYTCVISHRSGETIDSFIADLAVGVGAKLIKAGAPNSQNPERMAKYNRLVEIEQELS